MNATRTSIPLCKGKQLCMAILGKRALFLLSENIASGGHTLISIRRAS